MFHCHSSLLHYPQCVLVFSLRVFVCVYAGDKPSIIRALERLMNVLSSVNNSPNDCKVGCWYFCGSPAKPISVNASKSSCLCLRFSLVVVYVLLPVCSFFLVCLFLSTSVFCFLYVG